MHYKIEFLNKILFDFFFTREFLLDHEIFFDKNWIEIQNVNKNEMLLSNY